jgi:hypothetical protein
VLNEYDDVDKVDKSVSSLAVLVSIVELLSIAELDGTSALNVDDSLSMDELSEEVAVIAVDEESSKEELLPTLEVPTADSLDVATSDEDDKTLATVLVELSAVALPGCVLLSVEYWVSALLELGD